MLKKDASTEAPKPLLNVLTALLNLTKAILNFPFKPQFRKLYAKVAAVSKTQNSVNKSQKKTNSF